MKTQQRRVVFPILCAALVGACTSAGQGQGRTGTGGAAGSPTGTGGGGPAAGSGGSSGSGGAVGSGGVTGRPDASDDRPDVEVADAAPADVPHDVVGDGPSAGRQVARPVGSTAAALGYYEYLPPGYGDGGKRPVLFFFHGVGENGNGAGDLSRVTANGPPKLIAMNQWPASRPFIVLSPQHPPSKGALDPVYIGFDCWTPAEIHDFVAFALTNYQIDPHRIYLTGLSCGAMGSANYFKQYGAGQGVAAAALISGNANIFWPTTGCALVGDIGFWAFHGDADPTVPISGDNMALVHLTACPPPRKDVRYTVYPGGGHDVWTQTYDLSAGNDVYAWLLGFSR
jgi:poly(3-hydroxybutyrate) depolymerase